MISCIAQMNAGKPAIENSSYAIDWRLPAKRAHTRHSGAMKKHMCSGAVMRRSMWDGANQFHARFPGAQYPGLCVIPVIIDLHDAITIETGQTRRR
ncbi:MAG: hypothetical protein V7642_5759 [Burkholderiales bacterium]|jgi:hypothetical protein